MTYSALTAVSSLEAVDGPRVHEAQTEEDEPYPNIQRVEHLASPPFTAIPERRRQGLRVPVVSQ